MAISFCCFFAKLITESSRFRYHHKLFSSAYINLFFPAFHSKLEMCTPALTCICFFWHMVILLFPCAKESQNSSITLKSKESEGYSCTHTSCSLGWKVVKSESFGFLVSQHQILKLGCVGFVGACWQLASYSWLTIGLQIRAYPFYRCYSKRVKRDFHLHG